MGVFVLGMHRSGTSAVTRVIDLLGVPVGEPRMEPQPDNPTGFWEVTTLVDLNDELLAHLGGAWDAPPPPRPAGWEHDGALDDLRSRATTAFAAAHRGTRWVWKDPRACLVLPFWRVAAPGDDVAVVVLRNPLDVAWSLNRRNGVALELGLALWERYVRAMVCDAAGLPALVLRYDDLLDDPRSGCERLQEFLVEHHQADARPLDVAAIDLFLAPGLRHGRRDRDALAGSGLAAPGQLALFDLVEGLVGAHTRLTAGPLPEESASTEPLLAARRAAQGFPIGPDVDAGRLAVVLDRLGIGRLGEVEGALEREGAELARLRASTAGVREALGYTDIGKLERLALRGAGRVRGLQQRLTRARERRARPS